jgi:predicted O-methyltransferase YrrM
MVVNMEIFQFTADWFGGNILNWQSWLGPLAGKPGVSFLEIGSYEGRSAIWLLGNVLTHETASIDCLDPFVPVAVPWLSPGQNADYESRFDHNIRAAGCQHKVRKLKACSQEALRQLPLNHYDAIYVDGSHAAPDVLEDAVLAFRLLKSGGLLIFDDYEWNAFPDPWLVPRMSIDFFLHIYQQQYDLLHKGYQVAIKKK